MSSATCCSMTCSARAVSRFPRARTNPAPTRRCTRRRRGYGVRGASPMSSRWASTTRARRARLHAGGERDLRAGRSVDCVVVARQRATMRGCGAGSRALGVDDPVHGACVRRGPICSTSASARCCARFETLCSDCLLIIGNEDILAWGTRRWSRVTGASAHSARETLGMLARQEGLFVDPVYTAKSLAILIDLVRRA